MADAVSSAWSSSSPSELHAPETANKASDKVAPKTIECSLFEIIIDDLVIILDTRVAPSNAYLGWQLPTFR